METIIKKFEIECPVCKSTEFSFKDSLSGIPNANQQGDLFPFGVAVSLLTCIDCTFVMSFNLRRKKD